MSILRVSQAAICWLLLAAVACSGDDPARPHAAGSRIRWVAPDGSGQYRTIQAAINASADGDTVILRNGRYAGAGNVDLDFGGRNIVLTGRSSDATACTIGYDGAADAPYRGMWFHNAETTSAVVQNLSIDHGDPEGGGGGAVLCESASPTFRNVIFHNNFVEAVTSGGGSPQFIDCVFHSNYDGALGLRAGSPRVSNCLFASNYVDYSGAGVSIWYSHATVEDCVFIDNAAGFAGAAIESWATGESGRAQITVERCLFKDNTSGYHGGAVICMETALAFNDCVFTGNACGIMGGALDCSHRSPGTIRNCVFYGNGGTEGAAINCQGDSLVEFQNCVISANSGSAAVQCGSYTAGPVKPRFLCSDIYGNAGGDWIDCIAEQDSLNHNLSVDPQFCNAPYGDFRLQTTSPLTGLECPPLEGWTVGCASEPNVLANWQRLILRAKEMNDSSPGFSDARKRVLSK